jgi:hypothetical protein
MTQLTQLQQTRVIVLIALTMAITLVPHSAAMAQELSSLTYPAQTASSNTPQNTTAVDDDKWHLGISPYLWFAGVHGTIGVRDRSASFHASAGDVFSKLNIGLMGAVEARKRRFVLPLDFMWIKLSDDKAIPESPFPGLVSIKAKVTQTIFTPKAGYRVMDNPKLRADALVGLRYWHLSENLSFQPSGLLENYSQAANFVDVIAGAKITMTLSPKASVTILGDAGAGQANLDYQVAAFLGYKIKTDCHAWSGLAISRYQLSAQFKLYL